MPDFFLVNFALFAAITAAGTLAQSYLKQQNKPTDGGHDASAPSAQSGSSRSLWRAYIVVYALVMGARTMLRTSFTYKADPHITRR